MKVLKRAPVDIHVMNGDQVRIIYKETVVDEDGSIVGTRESVVLSERITEAHHFDEGAIIESGAGEFGADYGLGGLFLEHKTP